MTGHDGSYLPDLRKLLARNQPVPMVEALPVFDTGSPSALERTLTQIATLLGEVTPADFVLPPGQAMALLLYPDSHTVRRTFPVDDVSALLHTVVQPVVAAPDVTGVKALEIGDEITMWVGAYDDRPTVEFLAGLTPNLTAMFTLWLIRMGSPAVFGPVVFTGAFDPDRDTWPGLTPFTLGLLETAADTGEDDPAERLALEAAARDMALRGAYLQAGPPH